MAKQDEERDTHMTYIFAPYDVLQIQRAGTWVDLCTLRTIGEGRQARQMVADPTAAFAVIRNVTAEDPAPQLRIVRAGSGSLRRGAKVVWASKKKELDTKTDLTKIRAVEGETDTMTMTLETLTVRKTPTGWDVDYTGTREEAEIRRLCGSARIPTPYTASVDPARVVARVQRCNATYHVVLRAED